MKALTLLVGLVIAGFSFQFFASPPAVGSPPPATPIASEAKTFAVDGGHSAVIFRIKHMDAAYFYGRFDSVSGELVVDEGDPSKSSVKITVRADSVSTGSGKRDEHVMGPDFFDAKQFPEMTFESSKVSRNGGTWRMDGELSFHGVTKKISLDFEKIGEGPGRRGGTLVGFHSTFTFNRSDWGMDFMSKGLGDELEITVSLEAASSN